jgi:acyl carrier protein
MIDVTEKLDSLILDEIGTDEVMLNDFTDLSDDFAFDSIDIIALIVRIENEFGIEFPDDALLFENIRKYIWLKNTVTTLSNREQVHENDATIL